MCTCTENARLLNIVQFVQHRYSLFFSCRLHRQKVPQLEWFIWLLGKLLFRFCGPLSQKLLSDPSQTPEKTIGSVGPVTTQTDASGTDRPPVLLVWFRLKAFSTIQRQGVTLSHTRYSKGWRRSDTDSQVRASNGALGVFCSTF